MGEKMEKKLQDEDWERLLEEQYLKEADLIEEELFSDGFEEFEDETEEETDAAYEKLVARLKENGDYREDFGDTGAADEQKEEDGFGKVVPMEKLQAMREDGALEEKRKRRVSFKTVRVAGFAAVCVLGVFAASMTSEANRRYFIETIEYWSGDDTEVIVGNDITNESKDESEDNIKREIEEVLGIEMPEWFYVPKGLSYYDYDINEINGVVHVEYLYEEKIVALTCWKKDDSKNSINFSLHGNNSSESNLQCINKITNTKINISEIRGENDTEASYVAQWEYNNVFYQLSGKIALTELVKLIENFDY